ncbi:MAG TPA: TIR domain-containing protein, partial [Gaiellaceae bacterium]|nr:TIR domain-containing protein [Gaiellaceae bacterium]
MHWTHVQPWIRIADLPKIFISYRSKDTKAYAGRLHDGLAARFGKDNVFIDVEALAPGVPFEDAIYANVAAANVLFALIGRSCTAPLPRGDANGVAPGTTSVARDRVRHVRLLEPRDLVAGQRE